MGILMADLVVRGDLLLITNRQRARGTTVRITVSKRYSEIRAERWFIKGATNAVRSSKDSRIIARTSVR
jgi:hypothetical protein